MQFLCQIWRNDCFIPGLDSQAGSCYGTPTTLGYSKLRLKRQSGHVTDEGLDVRLTSRKLLSICYRRIGNAR